MQNYFYKLKLTFPTFVGISICSIIFLALFRWLLTIRYEILTIKEDVFLIWIPLVFPWIPILIWLRPKLRVLGFKKDNDRGRMLFQFIAWLTITASLITSQEYLSTSTGTLTELSQVGDFNSYPKSKYYIIKNLEVAKEYGGSYTDFRTSGRHNERLNFNSYFVYPILNSEEEQVSQNHLFWFGIEYRKDISSRLSTEEKEAEYKTFWNESAKKFENYDFKKIRYFVNVPYSSDFEGFIKAVGNRTQMKRKDLIILSPITENFDSRSGQMLPWTFKWLGIGFGLFLLLLLWPYFDVTEYENRLRGTKPKQDDLKDALRYLIPSKDHFATSVIIDLNLIVYLIMIFSGIHLLYPNGIELLEWGANRRKETLGGEWWRLLTSTFLHGGIMHLLLNIGGLVIGGIFVEPLLGRTRYFIIYLISGISGSLASIYWHTNTVSVGASGAIFGLYGAMLGLLLTKAIPQEEKSGILLFIGGYLAINLVFGLIGGIDNAAHIGGLLAGAITGIVSFTIGKSNT